MEKVAIVRVLLILFWALTAASIFGVYYTHQLPAAEPVALCTYQHSGTYNYIAQLSPNIIYNKTTLTPGEGTLYTAIVSRIDITFNYAFASYPHSTTLTTEHYTNIELESPGKWTKTLTASERQELFQLTDALNFTLQVETTKIKKLAEKIDSETGTRSTTYNVNVKPNIHIKAETSEGVIDETFTPTLTMAFKTDPTVGNYITIETLQQTKEGKIQETKATYLPYVLILQYASYIFLAASISATALTTVRYLKLRPGFPPKAERPIEKIIEPYKDIIAETAEEPLFKPDMTTIRVATMEDLARISEALAKPILRTSKLPIPPNKETTHIFYIIDNNTKYQYESSLQTLESRGNRKAGGIFKWKGLKRG